MGFGAAGLHVHSAVSLRSLEHRCWWIIPHIAPGEPGHLLHNGFPCILIPNGEHAIAWQKDPRHLLPPMSQAHIIPHQVIHDQDNVLLFCQDGKEPRVYVREQVCLSYLHFFHEHPLSGHLAFHKVLDKIHCRVYWRELHHKITSYIKECKSCQANKSPKWFKTRCEGYTHSHQTTGENDISPRLRTPNLVRSGTLVQQRAPTSRFYTIRNPTIIYVTLRPPDEWIDRVPKPNLKTKNLSLHWSSTLDLDRILPFVTHTYNTTV